MGRIAQARGTGSVHAVSAYVAIAEHWDAGQFTLLVERRADGREVWGDEPIPAARFEDVPRAATARLQGPVAWRVVGVWRRDGNRWIADAEIVKYREEWRP